MLIHPNSITHEDTIMPKKIRKIFRKSPRPRGGETPLPVENRVKTLVSQGEY